MYRFSVCLSAADYTHIPVLKREQYTKQQHILFMESTVVYTKTDGRFGLDSLSQITFTNLLN